MKQLRKGIVVLLAVVGIFWGISGKVMAEGTQLATEIVEKYIGDSTNKYYDVGASVGNGAFEIKSTSNSLKAGDEVDVQIIYNTDNAGSNLSTVAMSLYYDKDLLQYSEVIENDVYGNSAFKIRSVNAANNGVRFLLKTLNAPFGSNGCIATVRFIVKQDMPTVTIYGGNIDASFEEQQIYYPDDDLTDDGGYKVISVTVENTAESIPTPTVGTFTLMNGTCEGNGEVVIPIKIQTNDGFAALGLTIDYDASLFDYKSLEIDSSLADKIALKDVNPTEGQIKAAFVAGQNITDVGNFLHLKLETKGSAQAGTSSDVTVAVTQVANYEEESLNGIGAKYTVTLKETGSIPDPAGQKLGDVNDDGNVDLLDALCVLQNFNGVKELSNDAKTAADVDKNGTVDLVDALRIMKYYNGEINAF